MSSNIVSVKQLKEWLDEFPDDMLVALDERRGSEAWDGEGHVDGPLKPFVIQAVEVRTGWNLNVGQDTPYGEGWEYMKAEYPHGGKILVLSTSPQRHVIEDLIECY